jgi:2'-5' RNA ligase
VRLFVAVNPPSRFVDDLATRLDTIRREIDVAWTRPRAWHLTLAFLGDWPAERLEALKPALRRAVAGRAPFPLEPGGVGAFPDLRRPRVLFLHLDGGEALDVLADDVRRTIDAVWPDGPQDRKAFRPHLTLARVKRPLPAAAAARLGALDLGRWEAFPVDRARLVASELRREGSRHALLADLPFDASSAR